MMHLEQASPAEIPSLRGGSILNTPTTHGEAGSQETLNHASKPVFSWLSGFLLHRASPRRRRDVCDCEVSCLRAGHHGGVRWETNRQSQLRKQAWIPNRRFMRPLDQFGRQEGGEQCIRVFLPSKFILKASAPSAQAVFNRLLDHQNAHAHRDIH
jgi:hypothetical protein